MRKSSDDLATAVHQVAIVVLPGVIPLVRCDLGQSAANAVARFLVSPPHREGGQAQFIRHAQTGTSPHHYRRTFRGAPAAT